MRFFELRGKLSARENILMGVIGALFLLGLWFLLSNLLSVKQERVLFRAPSGEVVAEADTVVLQSTLDSLTQNFKQTSDVAVRYPKLPTPDSVVRAFVQLAKTDNPQRNVFMNAGRSLWLNAKGYGLAILISLPLGFLLGLFPFFRSLFSKPLDSLRYIPLSAIIGLFLVWLGMGDTMKYSFLAFGIIVYLLPTIVQRIDEVEDIYVTTVYTLGANKWQTIQSVFLPAVLSRISDDLRVLTAISWTYIIIAELQGNTGGLGGFIFTAQRQGQVAQMFAVLLVIVLIGVLQDWLFYALDRFFFPFKHVQKNKR